MSDSPVFNLNLSVQRNKMAEIHLLSANAPSDSFHQPQLDALVTKPDGSSVTVPCFWDGGVSWGLRYASSELGVHTFRTRCSDDDDTGLHDVSGEITVIPYSGDNPLYLHGPLEISENRRHFQYADGEPFFWLGDTWWMGMCKRLSPEGFRALAEDRRRKGFTVIQIVAGLYPDMPAFDERGANEEGFPWEEDYRHIRPEYFRAADQRLLHLVESGLAPCLVGAWGYFMGWMGVERLKLHWRNLVARYGALPIVWCVAGEANLPYYLTEGFPFDDREQVKGWTEVARYVREIDPFHRPLSIHPTGLGRLSARGAIDDETLLDFDMLQTGHGLREVLPPTIRTVRDSRYSEPTMPVINSEVCYEALMDKIPADIQRLMFWACVLNGAAGHTYGANGIWQVNRRDLPHGASPHGGDYGHLPWDDAMNLPGSRQLAMAKSLLTKYPWFEFEPHPEWAAYNQEGERTDEDASDEIAKYEVPYAAGMPRRIRVIYAPRRKPIEVRGIESNAKYHVIRFDPASGESREDGVLKSDSNGRCVLLPPEHGEEAWVVVLEIKN